MSFVYAGQYTEAVLGRGASGTGTFLQPTLAVNVYQVGTTTPVTLYTDRTKGATTANPVNTDAGGNLTFYADPGHYDLVFTPAGGTSQRVSVVVPLDPGELSAAYVAAYLPEAYGAVAVTWGATGSMASSSAVLTDPGANFPASCVGNVIVVKPTGYSSSVATTILSRQSATQVTLAANAPSTLTSVSYAYGPDAGSALTAMAAAVKPGATVWLAGLYLTTGAGPTFSVTCKIMGGAAYASNGVMSGSGIATTSQAANGLVENAPGLTMQDFGVFNLASATPTGGAGISVTNGTSGKKRGVTVSGFYNCLDYTTTSGRYWSMTDNCQIADPVNYGVWIHNTTPSGDEGDMTITECAFPNWGAGRTPVAAIEWNSGGGLRFKNNKINQGYNGTLYQYGVDINVGDGVETVDIFVVDNSIENWSAKGVNIRQQGPSNTGRIGNIIITDNEVGFPQGGDVAVNVNPASATGVGGAPSVYGLTVAHNSFPGGFGVVLQNVTGATIGPNDFGATTAGCVYIRAGCTLIDATLLGNVATDDVLLIEDDNINAGFTGTAAGRPSLLQREIPSTSSTVTYTTLYHFTLPQRSTAMCEVTLTGQAVNGGDGFVIQAKRALTRGTGAVTATTIGTDTAMGGGTAGAPSIDYLFDTATTSGDVYIKVRLTAGSGAAGLGVGKCVMRLDGGMYILRKGT